MFGIKVAYNTLTCEHMNFDSGQLKDSKKISNDQVFYFTKRQSVKTRNPTLHKYFCHFFLIFDPSCTENFVHFLTIFDQIYTQHFIQRFLNKPNQINPSSFFYQLMAIFLKKASSFQCVWNLESLQPLGGWPWLPFLPRVLVIAALYPSLLCAPFSSLSSLLIWF